MIEMENVYRKLEYYKLLGHISKKALSSPGCKRILSIKPFNNLIEIKSTQDKIWSLMSLIERGEKLPIGQFNDIRDEILKGRVKESFYPVEVLNELRNILTMCAGIKSFYAKHKDCLKPLSFNIVVLDPLLNIRKGIDKILDINMKIKSSASPQLAKIRAEIKHLVDLMHIKIEHVMTKARKEGWLMEDKPTIRDGRLVIPVRTEFKRKVSGVIHGQSATGQTTFIEPMEIVDINNKLVELEEEEKDEIRRILKNVTKQIRPNIDTILANIVELIELDYLSACATYGVEEKCSLPEIVGENNGFYILNARHPVLAKIKDVIPLNFQVSGNIKAVVITGPNAGGKTVAMKTVGILSLMAMCGLPIPADKGSYIPFFDKFLVDIGDQQSIEDDLSTFTSHMKNLKNFIDVADNKSLILIDELGTGTDPVEGSALGRVIVEEMIGRGAFTIVTTHHNALKAFAEENPKVVNAGMDFDPDRLEPTYKLKVGIPGNSFAIEISKRIGLDSDLLERARSYIGKDVVDYEKLLLEIDKQRKRLEIEREEVERAKKTLDKVVQEYQKRLDRLKEKEKKFEKQLKEKLMAIVEEYKRELNRTIKEIRETKADKMTIKKTLNIINDMEKDIKQRQEKKKIINVDLNEGDMVLVKVLNKNGIIKEVNKKTNKASVVIDDKILVIDTSELELVEQGDKVVESNKYDGFSVNIEEDIVSTILDIRGKYPDEAEGEVIRFIDRAMLKGVKRAEIVHGKGTGVLQKLVWNLLKNIKGIRNYYFDVPERGGSGKTIVEFE